MSSSIHSYKFTVGCALAEAAHHKAWPAHHRPDAAARADRTARLAIARRVPRGPVCELRHRHPNPRQQLQPTRHGKSICIPMNDLIGLVRSSHFSRRRPLCRNTDTIGSVCVCVCCVVASFYFYSSLCSSSPMRRTF